MQTDIPLKRLTALRGADLLPLFGLPHASLIVRLVGKEQIMQSELFNYVFQDQLAAFQKEKARLETEKAELEAKFKSHLEAVTVERETKSNVQHIQQALVEASLTRFQTVPLALVRDIWRVTRPEQAHALIVGIVQVATLEEFEALLKQAVNEAPDQP